MSRKKERIAIYHNLPSGGAKRYLYEVVKNLKNYKFDEYTLSTASDYLELAPVVEETKIYRYSKGKNLFEFVFNALFKLPVLQKEIAKEIDSKGYKYVFVNHDFIVKSPFLLKYLKTPSVYFCHEPQREFYEPQSLHSPLLKDKLANLIRYPIKLIDRKNARSARILVANSKYSQLILKKVYEKKSLIVYPGVDINTFKPEKKNKRYVLAVGGLLPVKGHDFVIKSLALIEKDKRPTLAIVGEGRKFDKKKLVSLAAKCKVKILFFSQVSDREIVNIYNSAICLVCAAHGEPFGMSLLEAMSCQVPVVAIKDGGIGEQIIDKKTGYLVRSRNKKEFAQKITLAINEHFELGSNARKYVIKNWQWQNSISSLIERLKL